MYFVISNLFAVVKTDVQPRLYQDLENQDTPKQIKMPLGKINKKLNDIVDFEFVDDFFYFAFNKKIIEKELSNQ